MAGIVDDFARVRPNGVLFVFDDGTRVLLEGLTTTAGLEASLAFL